MWSLLPQIFNFELSELSVLDCNIFLCVFFLSPDQGERAEKKQGSGDAGEEERKPRRKAYVHKPFLYSRYYSDSDDEITVEERRRSAVSYLANELITNFKTTQIFMVRCFNYWLLSLVSLSVLIGEGQRRTAAQ